MFDVKFKWQGVVSKGSCATLELEGHGVQYEVVAPAGVKLERLGKRVKCRNGMVEPFYADVKGLKMVYVIRSLNRTDK